MNTQYDVVIIGGGIAGVSAALTCRSRGKSVAVIANGEETSSLYKAERITNYPGIAAASGKEICEILAAQLETSGAEPVRGRALSVMPIGESFGVAVGSEFCSCSAVILAAGITREKLYPGEGEFLGRGVSYCATCDGMLYRGKDVVVAGRTPDAPEEAKYLQSIGCRVTYTAPKRPDTLDEDIPFVAANRVEIKGEQMVNAVALDGADVPCAGVFVLRASLAPTDLLPTLETEGGYIKVDRAMKTNVEGVFACGDCTGAPLQVAKAVGEGHIAGLSACEYLDKQQ